MAFDNRTYVLISQAADNVTTVNYIRVSGAIACNTGDIGYFVVCVYKDGVVYKRGTGKVLYNPGSCNAFSMMVPVIAGTVLTIWVYTDGADQLTNAATSTWCQFEMLPN